MTRTGTAPPTSPSPILPQHPHDRAEVALGESALPWPAAATSRLHHYTQLHPHASTAATPTLETTSASLSPTSLLPWCATLSPSQHSYCPCDCIADILRASSVTCQPRPPCLPDLMPPLVHLHAPPQAAAPSPTRDCDDLISLFPS